MSPRRSGRWLAAFGAVLAGAGVALSAYAAHADGGTRLQPAALMSLVHGVALAALAGRSDGRVARMALLALLMGVLLFSGSLVGAHLAAWSTRLAPAGGLLMIGGWLLYAIAVLRPDTTQGDT